eukprot:gnl/Ergobibamus_cyprinoides/5988.p1 GENE.gnl/Ergobibamus_cyprinoides/5988~~gnl/Ergobibamus_cyprinoides/5988.p1  ORF type:complete len:315 (+),score=0.01 gnl/Ergobibamus_cyprinoides/5988:84-1028(+)
MAAREEERKRRRAELEARYARRRPKKRQRSKSGRKTSGGPSSRRWRPGAVSSPMQRPNPWHWHRKKSAARARAAERYAEAEAHDEKRLLRHFGWNGFVLALRDKQAADGRASAHYEVRLQSLALRAFAAEVLDARERRQAEQAAACMHLQRAADLATASAIFFLFVRAYRAPKFLGEALASSCTSAAMRQSFFGLAIRSGTPNRQARLAQEAADDHRASQLSAVFLRRRAWSLFLQGVASARSAREQLEFRDRLVAEVCSTLPPLPPLSVPASATLELPAEPSLVATFGGCDGLMRQLAAVADMCDQQASWRPL